MTYQLSQAHVMIIVPKSVIIHWGNKFQKWSNIFELATLPIHFVHSDRTISANISGVTSWQMNGGVLITSQPYISMILDDLDNPLYDYFEKSSAHRVHTVIIDEGHDCFHGGTQIHHTLWKCI
jgi:SNF2 family DNA or RNA helicase